MWGSDSKYISKVTSDAVFLNSLCYWFFIKCFLNGQTQEKKSQEKFNFYQTGGRKDTRSTQNYSSEPYKIFETQKIGWV